ncbi:hypothetical protein AAG570_011981 [Ranatra chinensis]|uniref:Uncharacterized protein n=1 Tax=Ranatra chinensis TaxID=642074 RepID=A0ABD0YHH4_9HEMI
MAVSRNRFQRTLSKTTDHEQCLIHNAMIKRVMSECEERTNLLTKQVKLLKVKRLQELNEANEKTQKQIKDAETKIDKLTEDTEAKGSIIRDITEKLSARESDLRLEKRKTLEEREEEYTRVKAELDAKLGDAIRLREAAESELRSRIEESIKLMTLSEKLERANSAKCELEVQVLSAQSTIAKLQKENSVLISEVTETAKKLSALYEEISSEKLISQRLTKEYAEELQMSDKLKGELEKARLELNASKQEHSQLIDKYEEELRQHKTKINSLQNILIEKERDIEAASPAAIFFFVIHHKDAGSPRIFPWASKRPREPLFQVTLVVIKTRHQRNDIYAQVGHSGAVRGGSYRLKSHRRSGWGGSEHARLPCHGTRV